MLRKRFGMCEVIDNGKTRVVNRGVDVAVFTTTEFSAEAMKASRTLVVKGISTAVIEVMTLEPLDKETFISFAEKTGALVFAEQSVYEAVCGLLKGKQDVILEKVKEPTIQGIIETTLEVVKRKLY